MQRPKLVVEPIVDQVVFFYKISIITNKNKSFKGLKLNIFRKFQFHSTKARV